MGCLSWDVWISVCSTRLKAVYTVAPFVLLVSLRVRIHVWSMIYDSETALYRRFVQCATPAFDRQRTNRIDLQRLMQYLWVLGMPYCVARCV